MGDPVYLFYRSPIGTSNASGIFNNLKPIIIASCSRIHVAEFNPATINNYTWNINSYNFTKLSWDNATGFITVKDSKGKESKYTIVPEFPTEWFFLEEILRGLLTKISMAGWIRLKFCESLHTIKKVALSAFLILSLDTIVNYDKLCNTFGVSIICIKKI